MSNLFKFFQVLAIFVFYYIVIVECSRSTLGRTFFIAKESLNNSITSDTLNAGSLLRCARACKSKESTCSSVYFYEKTGICSLNTGYINVKLTETQSLSTNVQYMELRDGGCKGLLQMGRLTSGEVTYSENGKSITVFCDVHGDHGYSFISKAAISSLTPLDYVCQYKQEVMLRVLRPGGTQGESVLKQLHQYQAVYNLSFFLNRYDGYNKPLNPLQPYFYLAFLPSSMAHVQGTIQGYNANGLDFNFTSSDGNPNSYFIFFAGNQRFNVSRLYNTTMINGWITAALDVSTDRYLPTTNQTDKGYFMPFEVHFGGSGGLMMSNMITHVVGAAVGCRFAKDISSQLLFWPIIYQLCLECSCH
ncbi:hypothetical protein ACJMK2_008928 [Sinanodonta woodiana]|uniref:Apple domain-containing protein n=1 Tax=Sinanodonta woodiana TaxID=1069815 RepID=A0ABD3VAP6_SINWO